METPANREGTLLKILHVLLLFLRKMHLEKAAFDTTCGGTQNDVDAKNQRNSSAAISEQVAQLRRWKKMLMAERLHLSGNM